MKLSRFVALLHAPVLVDLEEMADGFFFGGSQINEGRRRR